MKKVLVLLLASIGITAYAQENSDLTPLTQELASNEIFIRNFEIGNELVNREQDTVNVLSDEQYTEMVERLQSISDADQIVEICNEYGLNVPDNLISLFIEQIDNWASINEAIPALRDLAQGDLTEVIKGAYLILLENSRQEHAAGCTTQCCTHYVEDVDDCDFDFGWATGVSILGGVASSLIATPAVGSGVVSLGIGAAYGVHRRCMNTAARGYRRCMGYE